MRRGSILAVLVPVFVILVVFAGACSSTEETKVKTDKAAAEAASKPAPAAPAESTGTVDEVAVLETNMGTMVLEFFPKDAPNHVANFKKLARKGFYDGTKFHRVIRGFMIQGGDPNSKDDDPSNDGLGGPGYTIKAEFNSRKHLKGTLSMARRPDPNSAGSQFFICLAPQSGLDGQYTVFGQVIKGMEVVDAIGSVELKQGKEANPSIPAKPVVVKKVTIIPRSELGKKKTEPEGGTAK
jgi:peptidyl-prolyl cis-trans isomerase B (cyclophilin B)